MILRRTRFLAPLLASLAVVARAEEPPSRRVLGLDEALTTAQARQPQLRQARATSEAAGARADEARAALLPQLSGTASYQQTTFNVTPRPGFQPNPGAAPAHTSWATVDFWSFGATATQVLFDYGQLERFRAARASAGAQRESEAAVTTQTALAVRLAFFNARAARDLVGVARDNLANQEAHLRQIEGFVAAGTRPAIDVALARTARANAQLQLINAENGYSTAKVQLNQAMGVTGAGDYDVGDDRLAEVPGEEQDLAPLVQEAVRARPDVAALEQQARAQELLLGSVRGAYAPTVGLSTGVTDAGVHLDRTVWNWNAQVTLSWGLFLGGLTRAQEREASATLEAARAQADALRLQVEVEVEQARLGVRAARAALSATGEALVNAREQLRLAERRYQTGVGSIIELGDSQLALTSAAAQQVQAEFNLSSARAQLLRALGREAPVR